MSSWRALDRKAWVGIALLLLLTLAGMLVGSADVRKTSSAEALAPPSGTHWFGTDAVGADMLSRTLYAVRVDVGLAAAGTVVSLVLGTLGGLLVSLRGRLAEYSMRGLDAFQSFPVLILALVLVGMSGNKLSLVVLAIAVVNVPRYMRLLRSDILVIRERRFVEAALVMGSPTGRVLVRHILPNIRNIILAQTSLTAANGIVIVSSLSFLGIGVQPPTPSWGVMIRQGLDYQAAGVWWVMGFPTLFVVIAVLSLNLIALGLTSAADQLVGAPGRSEVGGRS